MRRTNYSLLSVQSLRKKSKFCMTNIFVSITSHCECAKRAPYCAFDEPRRTCSPGEMQVPSDVAAAYSELLAMHPFSVGKQISARHRERIGVTDEKLAEHSSLTYGETPLETVARVLESSDRLRRAPGVDAEAAAAAQRREVFLDVGSGVGKPVFAAALLRPWARCIGVELMRGLHRTARELRRAFRSGLPFVQRGVKGTLYRVPAEARATRIELRCGDVTSAATMALEGSDDEDDDYGEDDEGDDDEEDEGRDGTESDRSPAPGPQLESLWSQVDVAFACSTCFDEAMMQRLSQAALPMRPGTVFATSGVRMSEDWGEVVECVSANMSWGEATIFIHVRRGDS